MSILEYKIVGNGPKTMIFIHGWPDGPDLWDDLVKHFSKKFRCVCLTLPNFGNHTDNNYSTSDLSFPNLVLLITNTINKLQSDQNEKKIILIGHDWGAYLSYMLEQAHPELIEKLITLDIGAHNKATSLGFIAFMVGYQFYLVMAWIIGKYFQFAGDTMTRSLAYLMKTPRPMQAKSQMNYMYYYLWRGILNKKYKDTILRKYNPLCPLLFLYGKKKPYMFHSQTWLKSIQEKPHSQVIEMNQSGHWIMKDEPSKTIEAIESWP